MHHGEEFDDKHDDPVTLRYYEHVAARFLDGESVIREEGNPTDLEWERLGWIASDLPGQLQALLAVFGCAAAHGLSDEDLAYLVVWWLGSAGPGMVGPTARRFYDKPLVVPAHDSDG